MRWESARQSTNIQGRRGIGGAGMVGGGGIGILILVLVFSFISGRNPLELLSQVEQTGAGPADTSAPTGAVDPNDPQARFVAGVLGDTEDSWNQIFAKQGKNYDEPVLVLFDGSVRSACGLASAAVGPFYCPSDHKLYLDLSFFRELAQRFGAPGDFAQAYVVAHEVGHHVQTLLGISDRVRRAQASGGSNPNALSVRMELQADCFAGVWGHHASRRTLLDEGDVEEGLRAAAAIGDDRLQRQGQGYVAPESFTHGSSEQRASWFKRGLEAGDPDACDTFSNTR